MTSRIKNISKQIPWVSLSLTAVAFLIHLFHPLRPLLLYTRADMIEGEFWRLLGCHWVHLNTDHLLWSSLTFLLLGSLCEYMDRKRYALAMGLSVILIPAAIWFGMPHLMVYAGLSGLDCALYSLGIVLFIRREKQARRHIWIILYMLMLVLLPAKIIYEMSSGLTIFVNNSHTDMVPVPLSHLVGGIAGILGGVIEMRKRGPRNLSALDLHIPGPAGK